MFWTTQEDEPQETVSKGTYKGHENKREEKDTSGKPQAPREHQQWEPPPEHSGHGLLNATPDTVQENVNGLIHQIGDPASVAVEFLTIAGRASQGENPPPGQWNMPWPTP